MIGSDKNKIKQHQQKSLLGLYGQPLGYALSRFLTKALQDAKSFLSLFFPDLKQKNIRIKKNVFSADNINHVDNHENVHQHDELPEYEECVEAGREVVQGREEAPLVTESPPSLSLSCLCPAMCSRGPALTLRSCLVQRYPWWTSFLTKWHPKIPLIWSSPSR